MTIPATTRPKASESSKPSKDGSLTPSEKKFVSSDDLYRHSSQYNLWSFTQAQLDEMRRAANEKGQKAALQRFEAARSSAEAENPAVFTAHGEELTSNMLELITYEEEQVFLRFICLQIIQICAHFNMPTQVRATAMSFFRKFYLVHSVMEYRPKNVAYTIVFLAAKLENYFILIESFCTRIPKTKAADILGLEFEVLQTLQFTLLVHHPFRPLWGFFLDFQLALLHPSPVMYDVSVDTIGKLYDQAKTWLNEHALLSDAPFMFTPPQIALAAFYDCDKRITDRYLRLKYLSEGPDSMETIAEEEEDPVVSKHKQTQKEQYDILVKTLKRCIVVAKQELPTSREESAKIDERCFFILSPQKLLKKKIKAFSA